MRPLINTDTKERRTTEWPRAIETKRTRNKAIHTPIIILPLLNSQQLPPSPTKNKGTTKQVSARRANIPLRCRHAIERKSGLYDLRGWKKRRRRKRKGKARAPKRGNRDAVFRRFSRSHRRLLRVMTAPATQLTGSHCCCCYSRMRHLPRRRRRPGARSGIRPIRRS